MSAALDGVFFALADPTRRRIIERPSRNELTAGEIAAHFSVSAPAISKHLKVLEQSGLLRRRIVGREHHLRLAPRAMRTASDWIARQERYWNEAFDRLGYYFSDINEEESSS